MKKLHLSALSLVAIVFGLSAGSLAAQTATTYTDGDLFIGFRASGNPGASDNYLLNIGQASTFRNQAVGTSRVLTLGNTGADLSVLYGANWSTRSDVLWSASGGALQGSVGADGPRTIYYSNRAGGDAWTNETFSTLSFPRTQLASQANGYQFEQNGAQKFSTLNSTVGLIQNEAEVNGNAYGTFQVDAGPNAASYNFFNGGGENNFGNGVAGASLDLFRISPTPIGTPGGSPGDLIGQFTINQAGLVTFTAVPEPGTVGLMAIAALAGAFVYFRRRNSKVEA